MILKNKKLLIITSLLTLLPIPLGLLLRNQFPETIAIHFGITGQPDGYASIPFAISVPPVIMLITHWLCIFFTALDKGNKTRNQKMQTLMLWIIPLLSNLSCCGIYALALGVQFSPVFWTMVPMGILFAIIGNYMPKTRMNATIGIKMKWTYSSEANWNATHRFAGKLWFFGGILVALGGFLPHGWALTVMFSAILVLVITPMVYSWRYYRKELAEGKELNSGYLTIDKKTKKISIGMLILLAVFLCIVLFYGDIRYSFQEDYLKIDSNMYSDYILHYDVIDSVEYHNGNIPGLRVGGYGSFRLLMGFFENEEFGTYTRYTYYKPEACVVVTTGNKTVVLSGKTKEETQALYQELLEITK